jgi:hypothetical protein
VFGEIVEMAGMGLGGGGEVDEPPQPKPPNMRMASEIISSRIDRGPKSI